jgi:hypothetical protein
LSIFIVKEFYMKILKPNETGVFGYLIESDSGYISNNLTHNGKSNMDLIREFKSGTSLSRNQELPEVVEIYAVLQKYGIENKNGRVYTKEILEREAKRYNEFIKMGTSLGELNHPESSIIDGERVSHMITEIWWEGRTLMGKLELDTTPGYHKLGVISSVGDKVANMIRKGWTVGISSRGVGSLKSEGGKNIVQEDFELICWDIVTSPSTPGSWISSDKSDLTQYTESTNNRVPNLDLSKQSLNESDKDLLNKLNKFL